VGKSGGICPKKKYVRSTSRYAIHLQFNISANALEIRALQSPKCVRCAVACTLLQLYKWLKHDSNMSLKYFNYRQIDVIDNIDS
jgi:hypothetical protein